MTDEIHIDDVLTPEVPVAIIRDDQRQEVARVPVEAIPSKRLPDGSTLQAGWQIHSDHVGHFEVQDGWTIQFPPFPGDDVIPVHDVAQVRQIVREELAALGGHLLAKYGGPPAVDVGLEDQQRIEHAALATAGGYLLGEYGDGQ